MPPRRTSGALVAVVILVTVATAYYWESLWCRDCLGELASLVTLFALGVAPLWYLLRKAMDRRDELTTISSGLYLELADARDGLDVGKHGDLRAVKMADGTNACFMRRMFNHDVYDSLIHSGRINAVKVEFQQQAQDVFQLIKDHNYSLRKVRDLENGTSDRNILAGYYLHLSKTDSNLRRRIPALMSTLKKEYRVRSDEKLRKFDPGRA